jgi:hypothetical protein
MISVINLYHIIARFFSRTNKKSKNINLKTSILRKKVKENQKKFGLIKYYALSLHRFTRKQMFYESREKD